MQKRAALVAYEQSNGTYEIHRSPDLGDDLRLVARYRSRTSNDRSEPEGAPTIVVEAPLETGLTFQQVIDYLDFSRFGTVIRVSKDSEVTPYRAPWFGLSDSCDRVYESEAFGYGAMVSVPQAAGEPLEDDIFAARYEGTKSTLGRLVDEGMLTAEQARGQLRELVIEFATRGREVRFATGQEPDAEESAIAELAANGRRLLGRR